MPTLQITPVLTETPSVQSPTVALTPAYPWLGQVLYADQTEDAVYVLTDRNADGDSADAGEITLFFNAANASGLTNPTANIFDVFQASNGYVYAGDGDTDTVYRLKDLNGDGDANDAGEANVWFSAAASGFTMPTPNGIAEGPDGAIYIVNAGVASQPADVVYRTVDLNGDGDANDAGEATVWLNLQTLNSASSAFDISFIGNVAYVTDTNGGTPDTVYRIEDANGNGTIDPGEATVFISETNSFGAPMDIANAAQGNSVLTYTWIGSESDPPRIYRLTDLNGSKTIDSADEAVEVWNWNFLPEGFNASVGFSIASDGDDIVLTSNGGAANQRNVIRLSDLNGDGDYKDAGEQIILLSNAIDAATANRPRAVSYYSDGTKIPHPLVYSEGGAAVVFAADLSIADSDSAVLSGAVVKIAGGFAPGDTLIFDIPAGSGIQGEYDPDTGVLVLAGAGSAVEYETILRSVTFEARTDDPSEALRHISITVYDERGLDGGSAGVATTLAVETDPALVTVFGSDAAEKLVGTGRNERLKGLDGDDVLAGMQGADVLDGGDGNDTASYSNSPGGVAVSLAAGIGFGGHAHGDTFESIENLIGSRYSDTLIGSGKANILRGLEGNDTLDGLEGDDTLIGGMGRDALFGREGADTFDFNVLRDSLAGSARDVIMDFEHGIDRIDLGNIDANLKAPGNQSFKWIGGNSFHKKAGELRIKDLGSKVMVEADLNGDGKADFQIAVHADMLSKADFIL